MKKWVNANIYCIKISDTKYSYDFAADHDLGYLGDGSQGFLEEGAEATVIEEAPEEEVAEIAFDYASDFVS